MKKVVEDFVSLVITDCLKHKCSVHLEQKERVDLNEDLKCSGYFDVPPILVVAIKKPQKYWLQTLVHEYCHFCQWKEQMPLFLEFDNINGMSLYDDWLSGKSELTKIQINKCTKAIQALEKDCEQRSIETIKTFNLPIDTERYTKRANSYLYFYELVKKYKKWYVKKSPYEVDEIVNIMPNKFQTSYKKLPDNFENLVIQYCF